MIVVLNLMNESYVFSMEKFGQRISHLVSNYMGTCLLGLDRLTAQQESKAMNTETGSILVIPKGPNRSQLLFWLCLSPSISSASYQMGNSVRFHEEVLGHPRVGRYWVRA
jgi:hypothetical protein